MKVLGIDIGGSGIKGAPVELPSGEFLAEHLHLPTHHRLPIERKAEA